MKEEKGFLARQKEEWRSFVFRAPSRRRWGLVGLALSLGAIYFGLSAEDPRAGFASLPSLGVLEGMGTLFGSLAELLPEEQTTLAGILRVWAGLFVGCGFALMMVDIVLGRWSSGDVSRNLGCAEATPGLHNVPRRARDQQRSGMTEYGITDLPALIEDLSLEDRRLAERILATSATTGRLDPPEGMRAWIEKSFGSVDAVTEQRIVKVTNRVTLEGTLFNGLRASRPLDTGVSLDLDREIAATEGDPFCRPEEGTPADVFGRVKGEHATTASNIAKYDGFHGVVVFDDHNPLHLTPEKVADYVSVGLAWCRKALEADPGAKYPFLMWNCLWRAGGSIIHGHAQVTATRDAHYPKVERLRRAAAGYRSEHAADYFGDLHRVHEALGLGVPAEEGVRAFASLTPVKEKEIVVVGADPNDPALHRTVGALLRDFVGSLGARAFNVAFYMPPPAPADEDWSDFPTIVHVVDRGDPANRTSDIGAMELYAAPVVASDPFRVAETLRNVPTE